LTAGDKLGPYALIAPIGAGGMGEVWRARDTRLDRPVAIKILPEDLGNSPERRQRFEQEARAVAALNHPNIVAVYDVGSEGGRFYLVQELVEGETLRALIDRGELPLRKALDLAGQIVEGLSAAHHANIVHRDIKPENMMVTRGGRAKILDFGLAKQAPAFAAATPEATRSLALTQEGVTVGTVGYMSPEQVRGQAADTRSDIFSFGVLLHEMLSGMRGFQRATGADTFLAVLKEELPELDEKVPSGVRQVVAHCVEKDPANRFQSTSDLAFALRALSAPSSAGLAAAARAGQTFEPARPGIARFAAWAAASLSLGLLLGVAAAGIVFPPSEPDLHTYRFAPLSREEATELYPQWSPGGKTVAYSAAVHGVAQIFTREMGAVAPAQITHATQACVFPFWSPDGSRIFYRSVGGLWSVAAAGGAPELAVPNSGAATIHSDGKTIAFGRAGKLMIGQLEGPQHEYANAAYPAVASVTALQFSPDGSKLAVVTSLPASSGRWALWIIPFPSGQPRRLKPGLSGTGFRNFSWFPDNRRLGYPQVDANDNTSVVVLDTETNRQRIVFTSPMYFSSLSISPDGKRMALGGGLLEWNLIEVTLPVPRARLLLARGGISFFPDWAPAGDHYLVVSNSQGPSEVLDRSPRQGFTRRLVSLNTEGLDPEVEYFSQPRWAPDGERFVFLTAGPKGDKLWVANAAGGRPVALDASVDESKAPVWSPDGRWIAYIQSLHGKLELAKIQPGVPRSKVTLSAAKPITDRLYGTLQWSPDGATILYPSASGLDLVSADGAISRALSSRMFSTYGFSHDGAAVIGVLHHNELDSPDWVVYATDTRTGAERTLGSLDLPANVSNFAGFSMHPSGDRFATSIVKTPFDIWMLEGFDERRTWLDRLLRREPR
jgi:Tol biopolymer transport system component